MTDFLRPLRRASKDLSSFEWFIVLSSVSWAIMILFPIKAFALPGLEDRLESLLADGDGHSALTILASKQANVLGRRKLLRFRYQADAMLGKAERAIEDLSELCKSEPLDTDLLMKRAALYRSIKKYSLAIKDLNLAEEILRKGGRSTGWVHYERALVFLDTNSESAAISDLIMAADIEESRFEAARALTKLALSIGRLSLALDYANRLVKLSPDDESCYIGRAKIYIRMRKKTLALKDLAMAMRLSPADFNEFDKLRAEIEKLD